MSINAKTMKFWQRKEVQIAIDVCRILLVIFVIFIIVYLIKEVQAVKILAYDPCRICMAKTGCSCWCI